MMNRRIHPITDNIIAVPANRMNKFDAWLKKNEMNTTYLIVRTDLIWTLALLLDENPDNLKFATEHYLTPTDSARYYVTDYGRQIKSLLEQHPTYHIKKITSDFITDSHSASGLRITFDTIPE